jgi:hypothetical protein
MNPWSNQAPDKPVIDGPTSGSSQTIYNYTILSLEPQDHDIIYEIDWDDGTNEYTPFYTSSDEPQTINHSWAIEGTYTIQVRAIDYYGTESDWTTLQTSIPKYKYFENLILQFFQQHPHLFSILQKLLNL